MMEITPATTTATAAGRLSELAGGYALSLDGFNTRMADRLRRVQILTGKISVSEQEETALTFSKDENIRS